MSQNIGYYITGLKEKNRLLDQHVEELPKLAQNKSEAEYAYDVALAKCILQFRADGEPVSIINKLAAGDSLVANLKLKAEIAKGIYDAKKAAIKSVHVAIDTYRSLLSFAKEEIIRLQGGIE